VVGVGGRDGIYGRMSVAGAVWQIKQTRLACSRVPYLAIVTICGVIYSYITFMEYPTLIYELLLDYLLVMGYVTCIPYAWLARGWKEQSDSLI
jgi:hypothetical protein